MWENPEQFGERIAGVGSLEPEEWEFVAGATLRCLLTTGCNIPIFVAAWPEIVPIDRPNEHFEWRNYYDRDDVLGWPLGGLSLGYAELVRDYEMEVGGSILRRFLRGWNPLAHSEYWRDRHFVSELERALREAIAVVR